MTPDAFHSLKIAPVIERSLRAQYIYPGLNEAFAYSREIFIHYRATLMEAKVLHGLVQLLFVSRNSDLLVHSDDSILTLTTYEYEHHFF